MRLERRAVLQRGAAARHGRNDAGCAYLADPAIQRVGNVKVAFAVNRHVGGVEQRCRDRLHAVAQVAAIPIARHGGNYALRIDFANAIVLGVSHINIAGSIYCYPRRIREPGA